MRHLMLELAAVYYVPHAAQTISATVGELPIVEALVNASGVAGVTYTDLVFQHATWMRPSTPIGFVVRQNPRALCCLAKAAILFLHRDSLMLSRECVTLLMWAVLLQDVQAGYCLACPAGKEAGCLQDPGDSPEQPPTAALVFEETASALIFRGARGVVFDGCVSRLRQTPLRAAPPRVF